MENSKICTHCGTVNKLESKFCINCGTVLAGNSSNFNNQNINDNLQSNKQNTNEELIGNRLGIISLILYFAGSFIITFLSYFLPISVRYAFSTLSGLCPLSGIVIMIIGRIKYPNNKLLKIAMWAIIVGIILGILAFIFIFVMCYISCSSLAPTGKI